MSSAPECRVQGIVFIFLGIVITWLGYWLGATSMASMSWPTARGRVLSSADGGMSSSGSGFSGGTAIYEYMVRDKRYMCDRISFLPARIPVYTTKVYPAGREVQVWYDPKKPSLAVLIPGGAFALYLPVMIGIGCLVAGVLVLYRCMTVVDSPRVIRNTDSEIPSEFVVSKQGARLTARIRVASSTKAKLMAVSTAMACWFAICALVVGMHALLIWVEVLLLGFALPFIVIVGLRPRMRIVLDPNLLTISRNTGWKNGRRKYADSCRLADIKSVIVNEREGILSMVVEGDGQYAMTLSGHDGVSPEGCLWLKRVINSYRNGRAFSL